METSVKEQIITPRLKLKWIPHFTVTNYKKKLRALEYDPCVYGWFRVTTKEYLFIERSKNGFIELLRRKHPIIDYVEEIEMTDEIHLWDWPAAIFGKLGQFEAWLIEQFNPKYNRGQQISATLHELINSKQITSIIESDVELPPNLSAKNHPSIFSPFSKPSTYVPPPNTTTQQ